MSKPLINLSICVILFNEKNEFLLVKKSYDYNGDVGGLWVLPGGGGGFEKAKNLSALAKQEIEYDLNKDYNVKKGQGSRIDFEIEESALKIFKAKCQQQRINIFTYCNQFRGHPYPNNEDIIDSRWFSIDEIRKMGVDGEIGYENHLDIYEFYEKFLKV